VVGVPMNLKCRVACIKEFEPCMKPCADAHPKCMAACEQR
jgi:hypothetical protein